MDLYEAIKGRRSVRSYKPDPIPKDVLERVLDAFRLAPSAGNRQPWKAVVVQDEGLREKLAAACSHQRFVSEAPCAIAACGLPNCGRIGGYTSSLMVDVAIAVDHLTLAAYAEGLGTCWIGAFDEGQVKKLLGIPEDVRVVAVTPLGYPAREGGAPSRKPLSEVVCYDGYE